ncbi:para-nitrobenzyl esterase [Leifsonia shinshuensis]|nr:para-nitrobenzyl esterase [Leifsonia shinshuensis]
MTAFLGVPFARPPVGHLRFRAPQPHSGWDRPLLADRFGDSPMQERSPYTQGLPLSEDCLTLNVWTPEGASERPVLFWIYGGGFAGGSSAVPTFDGARLAAEEGLVVVSANHRTGALGFASLTHRGLPEASNLGLRDVVAALAWVQENIAAFGGNAAQLTVAGQSSGAFLAAALLAVPEARRSFARLVLISGGASRIVPRRRAEQLGDQLLRAAGAGSGTDLLALSAQDIIAAQRSVGSNEIGARNAPVPDALGVVLDIGAPEPVLSAHPQDIIARGEAVDIPLLLIVAGAEVASLRGPDPEFVPADEGAIVREIAGWHAPDPASIVDGYDGDPGEKRESILTDFIYRLPAARTALAQNAAGGRAWLAQIDGPDGSNASHDIPPRVFFGNLSDDDPLTPGSAVVRGTAGRFTRGEEPDWAPFRSPEGEIMRLSATRHAAKGEFASMLQRWEGVDRP